MRIGEVLGLRFYAKLSFPPNSVALGIAGFSVLGIKKIENKGIVLGNSLQGVHAYYGHDVALPMLERSVRSVLIFIFIYFYFLFKDQYGIFLYNGSIFSPLPLTCLLVKIL